MKAPIALDAQALLYGLRVACTAVGRTLPGRKLTTMIFTTHSVTKDAHFRSRNCFFEIIFIIFIDFQRNR